MCSETAKDVEEEEEEEEEVGERTNKGDSVLSVQEEKLDWNTKEDVIGKGEQIQKQVNEEDEANDENEEEKHECEVFLLENMNYRGYSEDVLKDR